MGRQQGAGEVPELSCAIQTPAVCGDCRQIPAGWPSRQDSTALESLPGWGAAQRPQQLLPALHRETVTATTPPLHQGVGLAA